MGNVIELQDVNKTYRTGSYEVHALRGISLAVAAGEFVAIMGPSGSGKSSLMYILGLLDQPSSGQYILSGSDVGSIDKRSQAAIRNERIGFVFQQFNLLPRMTVLENVLLPTIYGRDRHAAARATKLIEDVGLADRIKHKSNELSGGQVQRVAIARALIMQPSIILADEPTGNLDMKTSHEILGLFRDIHHKGGTLVLITHEEEIARTADRIIKLRDGEIVEEMTT